MEITNLADERLTETDKKELAEKLSRSEVSPSSKHQTLAYKFYEEQLQTLGTPYDVTRIPISVLQQMERDPMLSFGLHFLRTPLIRAKWHIKCERADIAAFVDNALRAILPALIQQYTRSWNYGFSPVVKRFQLEMPDWRYKDPNDPDGDTKKVWDHGDIEAITWKTFIPLPCDPGKVEPEWDAKGQFNGMRYQGGALPIPFDVFGSNEGDGNVNKKIPLTHSLWNTNEKQSANGSLYGYPRVGYAYRFWWSFWFRWALYDRFFERKADPPYLVYFPTGYTSDEDDEDSALQNRALALALTDAARSGGGLALPGDVVRSYDDRATLLREWEIAELEIKGDMTHFVESFEYLDVMKLRSLWIPEQAFLEGKGGTSSRNVASEEIDIHKEGTAVEADALDEHINKYIIPDLVAANFPDFEGSCTKITTGFTDGDRQMLQNAVSLLGQAGPENLEDIDIREVLERLGYPLLSPDVIKKREEEAIKQLEQATPDPIAPVAGESAGVTDAGLYVQPGQVIRLEDTMDVPDSKHFKDKEVRRLANRMRSVWKENLQAVYEDFANFLEREGIKFDEAEETADDIVNRWEYDRQDLSSLLANSTSIVNNVIDQAGKVELKRIGHSEAWSPSSDLVADFLEDRGLNYVRAIDETTRNEIKTFLANKIREGSDTGSIITEVREHFVDFPDWRADRLVKTEVRDAYNFATILAGEQAGIKIVQAIDGTDFDDECRERNGKFFKIAEAYNESAKEHPNGTLEWRLTTRENLSVLYVEEMPDEEEVLGKFDAESDTIYLLSSLPVEIQTQYLLQLGESFESK